MLGVPIFAVVAEGIGIFGKDQRYDRLSKEFTRLLLIAYMVAYLDRINLGFATLQMSDDLKLSDRQFGFGAGIFYFGYLLFEVPSNLILARVGASRWIARIMISWGVIASAMMFVQGRQSFYSLRFLLGLAEAPRPRDPPGVGCHRGDPSSDRA